MCYSKFKGRIILHEVTIKILCMHIVLKTKGAIDKGRPRRGWEGGCRNPDKDGHREGGLTQQPGRPSLKKARTKNIFVFNLWNKKILTVK